MNTTTTHRSAPQRIFIIVAVIAQIGATFLPQLGLGEPIGERSDSVRTLITPSGWAFAIWGPLFFGSALFAVWQALPSQKDNVLLDRIGWFAGGAFLANGVWALYTQFANLTFISAIIISAGLACTLLVLRTFVAQERPFSAAERWIAVLPLSALAAWLSAATIVNITAMLKYHGVGGDGAQFPNITAAIVVVGGLIAALATLRSRGAPWYGLVFLWALLAIYFRGGQEFGIIGAAAIIAGILVLCALLAGLSNKANRYHWFGG